MILFNGVSNKCWFIVLLISGKCECALFGDYVDELKKKIGKSAVGLPIVVIQFAKVKLFRGRINYAFIHNVIKASNIHLRCLLIQLLNNWFR
jgi:hypothetical protein